MRPFDTVEPRYRSAADAARCTRATSHGQLGNQSGRLVPYRRQCDGTLVATRTIAWRLWLVKQLVPTKGLTRWGGRRPATQVRAGAHCASHTPTACVSATPTRSTGCDAGGIMILCVFCEPDATLCVAAQREVVLVCRRQGRASLRRRLAGPATTKRVTLQQLRVLCWCVCQCGAGCVCGRRVCTTGKAEVRSRRKTCALTGSSHLSCRGSHVC